MNIELDNLPLRRAKLLEASRSVATWLVIELSLSLKICHEAIGHSITLAGRAADPFPCDADRRLAVAVA